MNRLTNAKSKIGSYRFTTLTVVPGMMEYKGARIQILDLPGIIKGASTGKGLGKRVLSVVRSSDIILFIVEVLQPETRPLLINEDISYDQLIDVLLQNRKYIPTLAIVNKIDLVSPQTLNELKSKLNYDYIPISAEANLNKIG